MKKIKFTCKESKSLGYLASLNKTIGVVLIVVIALIFMSSPILFVHALILSPLACFSYYILLCIQKGYAIIIEAANRYIQSMPENVENQENIEPIQQEQSE